jgi:hypothetical protein
MHWLLIFLPPNEVKGPVTPIITCRMQMIGSSTSESILGLQFSTKLKSLDSKKRREKTNAPTLLTSEYLCTTDRIQDKNRSWRR